MCDREDSPLIDKRKRKRKRKKKRKFEDIESDQTIKQNVDNSSNVRKKKKKKKNKRRKLNSDTTTSDPVATGTNTMNKANDLIKKALNNNRLQLTQSVCCPICIVDLSHLSESEMDSHIQKCVTMYQQIKQRQQEQIENNTTITTATLHQQRREKNIKHKKVVNEWKHILKPSNNDNIEMKDDKIQQKQRGIPGFKKLKGTNIVINKFNYNSIENINNGYSVHFLTHFRYDYYIGVTSQWDKPIYCSSITAKLMKHMLNIKHDVIHELPMNQRIEIPDSNPVTFVTLFDAKNHIKGSVNLLFEITNHRKIQISNKSNNHNHKDKTVTINGQKNLSMHNWLIPYKGKENENNDRNKNKNIEVMYKDLYCGDFHFDGTEKYQILKDIKIRNLYLDTTFCHPKYKYISEMNLFEKIKDMIDQIFIKKVDGEKICFIFGIQFIERIKLLMYLAKNYNQKIFVNRTKKRLIDLLEFEDDDNERFTVLRNDAKQFQTLAINNITFKNLNKLLEADDECDQYIGIKLVKPKGTGTNIRKITKEKITLINVPYSDHSTFEELKQFVIKVKPLKIIPTANLKESTKYIAKYF